MKISVVIPSYRRIKFLKLVFEGLTAQTRLPDEVVVGVRDEDIETSNFIEEFRKKSLFPVKIALVTVPGVVASMQAAMEQTEGDLICLLDDDAEPLPDWFQRVEVRMRNDDHLGAIGGRDLLQDHPDMRRNEPTTDQVGVITFYGRVIGNHHRGHGEARYVDILKGCNVAMRSHLLKRFGFEQELRGKGAQVHWELALFLDTANAGWKIVYDPTIQVTHHIAPRLDDDQNHRGILSTDGLYDMAYNEHFVTASRAGVIALGMHIFWTLAVGTNSLPGLLNYLRIRLLKGDAQALPRFLISIKGLLLGSMAGLKRRQRCLRRAQNVGGCHEM
jgi:GT2 family glycosyltransferase